MKNIFGRDTGKFDILNWESRTRLMFHSCRQIVAKYSTVKSLNNRHLQVLKKLSVIERCPLLEGNLKDSHICFA